MNNLLLLLTVILGVVAIVDEMNLLKVKIPDTTKVLLLMCVLVLFLKTHMFGSSRGRDTADNVAEGRVSTVNKH